MTKKKRSTKIKELEDAGEIEIDINKIELEELLIAVGGVLFSGTLIEELDTPIMLRLEDLIKEEIIFREQAKETIH
jgi:hypothetical protein|tara:strand:- start:3963 stop:4190 length:228 start_codon:yes stop_codon:yes gene_type:complete